MGLPLRVVCYMLQPWIVGDAHYACRRCSWSRCFWYVVGQGRFIRKQGISGPHVLVLICRLLLVSDFTGCLSSGWACYPHSSGLTYRNRNVAAALFTEIPPVLLAFKQGEATGKSISMLSASSSGKEGLRLYRANR